MVPYAWAHPRPCIGLSAAMLLRHRLGGGSEERVHLHVLPLELRPADVAAREGAERGGDRDGGGYAFHLGQFHCLCSFRVNEGASSLAYLAPIAHPLHYTDGRFFPFSDIASARKREKWYNVHMAFPYTDELFQRKLKKAATFYWETRRQQATAQKKRGTHDAGTRGQVTGGKQLDGFAKLVSEVCTKAGFRKSEIFFNRAVPVPGYYRPQKNWDVVVLRDGKLVAAIELKSQSGSFGNNFNNRSEEVLGVARDFWKAYRERAFGVAEAPWIGYLFFLEDSPSSARPVSLAESPLPPMPVFSNTSYLRRYEILCERLVLERDYTATALLVSDKETYSVRDGGSEVGAVRFFSSLYSHLAARS